ncbi:hypothetical protein M427DRAFT_476506 [Gonapodya prolifera JEL478]|uniref:Uncharacterized protein n=1 Tax=Gonapodya prolifera (strain JEL478) TaxID=1344416 RepID=A0A139A118_GONPJ|nr:hypothetical protein M427DRAFT_476506 [Gonapodya prolifera JEL478]|eukprot:KXS10442.1 hypothetical protein M427DRAFT_476506 [Gonapodya prolifera JEL478]
MASGCIARIVVTILERSRRAPGVRTQLHLHTPRTAPGLQWREHLCPLSQKEHAIRGLLRPLLVGHMPHVCLQQNKLPDGAR